MFIVKKLISGREYYYIRESVRENGKVKSKTLGFWEDYPKPLRKFCRFEGDGGDIDDTLRDQRFAGGD